MRRTTAVLILGLSLSILVIPAVTVFATTPRPYSATPIDSVWIDGQLVKGKPVRVNISYRVINPYVDSVRIWGQVYEITTSRTLDQEQSKIVPNTANVSIPNTWIDFHKYGINRPTSYAWLEFMLSKQGAWRIVLYTSAWTTPQDLNENWGWGKSYLKIEVSVSGEARLVQRFSPVYSLPEPSNILRIPHLVPIDLFGSDSSSDSSTEVQSGPPPGD